MCFEKVSGMFYRLDLPFFRIRFAAARSEFDSAGSSMNFATAEVIYNWPLMKFIHYSLVERMH